jgi:hypothetical protein
MTSNIRKNTFIKSQKKRREAMISNNKKALSVYVNSSTKDVLNKIKREHGYTTLGDAIDYLSDKYQ